MTRTALADFSEPIPSPEIAAMPMKRISIFYCLILVIFWQFFASGPARAQGLEYVKAHYTKYEYRVPMRDGARLFTAVYVPKGDPDRHPILLTRTPYGVRPYGVDQYRPDLGPSPSFGKSGYVVAYQDVRGCYMSALSAI